MASSTRLGVLALLLVAGLPAVAAIPVNDLSAPVSIAGNWKFQPGDDLAWAAPDFDDSDWQATPVPANAPVGLGGYSGMLWYRVTMNLDMSSPSVRATTGALAVTIGHVMSAYEIYAGGQKLGGVGGLPPTPESRFDEQRTWSIPASAIGPDGRLVLALRIWRSPQAGGWETGPFYADFLLGNAGDLRALAMRNALLPNTLLACLYLVLGVYHLLIARRNPVLKEFFWFGLFSIALALYTFETSQAKFMVEAPYLLHKKIQYLVLYIMPVLFGRTLMAITRTPENAVTRTLNGIFALYFLAALLIPGEAVLHATLKSYQYLGMLWALIMASIMTWRAYKGSRSARIIVVLLLLLLGAGINDAILEEALIGSGNILYIVFALMLFCMALLMAERYTEILKKLESAVEWRTRELTEANRELAVAAEVKGNFLANMSHEMRTPMNAILGLTRLGLQTDLTEQQRDYFGKVEQSAEGLQDIIDSILDFSKLQDGQLECVSEPFEPAAVIEGVRRIWEDQAAEAGLKLEVNIDPDIPPRLVGDAKRLKQVLGIFISNAIKFTEQGQVSVDVQVVNSHQHLARLNFAVADTGPGIPAELREHLFEAFAQADNTMTRAHGGTGLGLSIGQRLVELMGGQIQVASVVGEGSTFSFELDLPVPQEDTAPSDAAKVLDLTPIRGARVLLVDDSDLNLQVAGELLRQAKLYVEIAKNGRDAVDKATSMPFDCILMDVQMPVMDGYTATERIRAKGHLENLPVLAMTANAMQQDRERGAQAGMNDYIPKPIEPDELYSALLQWIEHGERDYDEQRFATPDSGKVTVAELPDALPGLSISDGLKRVGGNTKLYLSLLRDLCKDYADAAERLQAMLDGGEQDAARQFAHKLRGIANNLGAERAGKASEVIELSAADGEAVPSAALQELAAALREVTLSQETLAPLTGADEDAAELDAEQRRALLGSVVKAVEENNPEALDLVEQLLAGVPEDLPGFAELTAARDALDMYDFAGAGEHLKAAAEAEGFTA